MCVEGKLVTEKTLSERVAVLEERIDNHEAQCGKRWTAVRWVISGVGTSALLAASLAMNALAAVSSQIHAVDTAQKVSANQMHQVQEGLGEIKADLKQILKVTR